MTREQKALLELVRIGATDECLFSDAVFDADWNKLYELACLQGVVCVCWRAVEMLYSRGVNCCPVEVKLQWYARSRQVEDYSKKKFAQMASFTENVKPLQIAVLKGVDYAQLWCNPLWREFGDLDAYAIDGNTVAIDKKATELGYKVEDGGYKHTHIHTDGLMIENHHALIDFAGSKEGELLEKILRELFKGEFASIQDTALLSPNAYFTAVYMIAHAQVHFFFEGMTLRQILDWHFFLTKEGKNVDWEQVEDVLERTKLKAFAVLLTQICKKHFGLRFNHFGSDSSFDDELVAKFLDDIFSDKMSDFDRRWWKMIGRMLNRYGRFIKFRKLNKMSVCAAIWKTLAYSSFLHRQPELNEPKVVCANYANKNMNKHDK